MNIIGVQFSICKEDFKSEYFKRHVEEFYRKSEPGDFIVFPEDIGLLTAFSDIKSSNLADAMKEFYENSPEKISLLSDKYPDSSFQSLLFLALTDKYVREFYIPFSEFSKKYGVYTLACNNMAKFSEHGGDYEASEGKVYNQAFVFGKKGELVALQKKVFLTDMENDLGLSSGRIEDVSVFNIEGRKFGIAISLDAFKLSYISRLSEAEIIIQPDANPEKWNSYLSNGRWQPEEWMDSSYYIAQRLEKTEYVVNPFMVGNVMELRFEGQSSITKKGKSEDEKIAYIGNVPTTGFHSILKAGNYDPSEFVERESVLETSLDFRDGTVSVKI